MSATNQRAVKRIMRSDPHPRSEELYHLLRLLGGQKVFLLVVITEQIQNLGAVQHIRQGRGVVYSACTHNLYIQYDDPACI